MITKFSNKNNMESETKDIMCLTFKILIHKDLYPRLDNLYKLSLSEVNKMINNREQKSSKFYKTIPCVLAKGLISKYQKNKRLKNVTRLVLPVCGDKGKQVKLDNNYIRIPAIFGKTKIQIPLPYPIIDYIRQVEFFKRDKIWYMSYCYNVKKEQTIISSCIGVDRNSVGNVVTLSINDNKFKMLGPDCSKITENFRNRRRKLQKKGVMNALKKIKRKQSRRTRDINHKVSKEIVSLAKLHCSAIVLEDLGKISKKGKAKRYVQKSQWSFYQLESFIKYKATLLGIPVIYINPKNTSKMCSKCGEINMVSGKKYKCSCGYVAHRDVNAAVNIRRRGEESMSSNMLGLIGDPLNLMAYSGAKQESLEDLR